jgi:hypothetical protein
LRLDPFLHFLLFFLSSRIDEGVCRTTWLEIRVDTTTNGSIVCDGWFTGYAERENLDLNAANNGRKTGFPFFDLQLEALKHELTVDNTWTCQLL